MTTLKNVSLFFLGVLFFSCNGATKVKVKDVKLADVKTTEAPLPPALTGLKVSAFLIYNDGTTSTIDILNDKTIALWNTIIGGGGALKPSEKTKIRLTGKLDSLKVTIYNGKRKVINQKLPNFSGNFELIINDTGCEEIKVVVTKLTKVVYQDKILFRCGE